MLALVRDLGRALRCYRCARIPLDALPDLSDTQVIIYSRWDRSPDIVEDQVTYPIVTALLGAPRVKAVRGFSDFGFSYVYVIFQDGTDLYWARSRVLEYLSKIQPRLPEGVQTELGPDATGVGWVFQYALVDRSGTALARRAALATRTGPALRTCSRCRASPRWRRSAASSSSTRSPSIPTASPPTACRSTDVVEAVRSSQQRGGRPAARDRAAPSTWCAAAATSRASTTSSRSCSRRDERARRCCSRDVGRSRSGPRSAAASPTSTARATPSAASSSCATARTRSTSSTRVKARSTSSSPALPDGRRDRHRPTTARS